MMAANFMDHRIQVQDGLHIFAREWGEDVKTVPIICLPGLTRNHRDFTRLAHLFSQGPQPRRVICIDLRGRGNSDRDPEPSHYNIFTEMADVMAVMDFLQISRADFIGTSRGGLIMHIMAGTHAERIRRVVLNDIGPVLEKQGLLQIRDYLNRADGPQSWEECPGYLQAVHGHAFPHLPLSEWQDMAMALYRDEHGKPVADYDPAIAAQIANMDFSQPLPDLWAQYQALAQFPLLIVRGENSALLSEECCQQMISRSPLAHCIIALAQGHAPLLHVQPVFQSVQHFLNADL